MTARTICTGVLSLLGAAAPGSGQSDVDTHQRHAFGENIGWTDWGVAGGSAEAVRVTDTFLAGYVWAENVGFINTGNAGPLDGVHYGNAGHTDFGVNIDPLTGELFGLAWGENVGWINFGGGAAATPPDPARLDAGTCRLRGYAWGENVGWINLDDTARFVGVALAGCGCPGDVDGDGAVGLNDLLVVLAAFGGSTGDGPAGGDLDGDGAVGLIDLLILLGAFGDVCE